MSKYSDQVKSDAAKAAQYIREHGWCQGATEQSPGGRVCALGAAWRATLSGDAEHALGLAFRDAASTKSVVAFNDMPGRTADEVIAVFDRIANS